MIYLMTKELERRLKEKNFPVEVIYGPDNANREPNRTCIIVERSATAPDTFGSALGTQRNERKVGSRSIAVAVHVFAKASVAGARRSEHESFCDKIVDAVHSALFYWGQSSRMPVTFETGSMWTNDDLKGSVYHKWPGVVYTINVMVARGVYDLDFSGEGLAEAIITDSTSTVS